MRRPQYRRSGFFHLCLKSQRAAHQFHNWKDQKGVTEIVPEGIHHDIDWELLLADTVALTVYKIVYSDVTEKPETRLSY